MPQLPAHLPEPLPVEGRGAAWSRASHVWLTFVLKELQNGAQQGARMGAAIIVEQILGWFCHCPLPKCPLPACKLPPPVLPSTILPVSTSAAAGCGTSRLKHAFVPALPAPKCAQMCLMACIQNSEPTQGGLRQHNRQLVLGCPLSK